jgi:hypothetical protein
MEEIMGKCLELEAMYVCSINVKKFPRLPLQEEHLLCLSRVSTTHRLRETERDEWTDGYVAITRIYANGSTRNKNNITIRFKHYQYTTTEILVEIFANLRTPLGFLSIYLQLHKIVPSSGLLPASDVVTRKLMRFQCILFIRIVVLSLKHHVLFNKWNDHHATSRLWIILHTLCDVTSYFL